LQPGLNEVLVENADDSIAGWYCPLRRDENAPAIFLKIIEKTQLHCPRIGRDADDWAVLPVSVLYSVRA